MNDASVGVLVRVIYELVQGHIVGNPCKFVEQRWARMGHPVIGDLVLEKSKAAHRGDADGLGWLVEIRYEEERGTVYTIRTLATGQDVHWENASIVALPLDYEWGLRNGNV